MDKLTLKILNGSTSGYLYVLQFSHFTGPDCFLNLYNNARLTEHTYLLFNQPYLLLLTKLHIQARQLAKNDHCLSTQL